MHNGPALLDRQQKPDGKTSIPRQHIVGELAWLMAVYEEEGEVGWVAPFSLMVQ